MGMCIGFGFIGGCGGKVTVSGDCFHCNGQSVVCHINELVMENLKPLCIIRASKRAVFLASSRPQWARPSQSKPAISTASFRLHRAPPKTSRNGTFKLIHLSIESEKRSKNYIQYSIEIQFFVNSMFIYKWSFGCQHMVEHIYASYMENIKMHTTSFLIAMIFYSKTTKLPVNNQCQGNTALQEDTYARLLSQKDCAFPPNLGTFFC